MTINQTKLEEFVGKMTFTRMQPYRLGIAQLSPSKSSANAQKHLRDVSQFPLHSSRHALPVLQGAWGSSGGLR